MSEKKPLLSISLLSSGRIATIERCLASLDPIRRAVDTEVVIADTDPEHRQDVRDILEKYADEIIRFEWIDDFAAARNAGVDACSGKWFLFLDDDEWFLEAQPLIDFLLSEEQEDYFWANFQLRNYMNMELTRWSETWISRMFRLGEGIRFHGRTHELFQPTIGEGKILHALIGHTGYIFENRQKMVEHVRRNLAGLETLMEEEPKQVRWVFQTMAEYGRLGDRRKERAMAEKGYRMMKGVSGYSAALLRGVFAADMVHAPALAEDWDEVMKNYRHLMAGEKLGKVAMAQMELDAAQAEYNSENLPQARMHCARYLQAYESITGKPVEHTMEYLSFLADTLTDIYRARVACMLMTIDIPDGKWKSFDRYFDTIPWDDSDGYGMGPYVKRLLETCMGGDYDKRFPGLLAGLFAFEQPRKIIQDYFRGKMDKENAASDDTVFWNMTHAMAESERKHWDFRIIWADHALSLPDSVDSGKTAEEYRGQIREAFENLFALMNPLLLSPWLWEIGLRRGAALDERVSEIPMPRWRACVEEFVGTVDPAFAERMAGLVEDAYMGLYDDHYYCFMGGVSGILEKARQTCEAEEAAREQQSIQEEMHRLIAALEGKVEELINAGMMEEAEKVMGEIRKYTPTIRGSL